jgi:uncharacterized membrane protein YhaH (DUF805 family)
MVVMIIGALAGIVSRISGHSDGSTGTVVIILLAITAWPLLALHVKRWHDRDKSGWWVFIICVPLVGGLWSFIECGLMPGTGGANQYGEEPGVRPRT